MIRLLFQSYLLSPKINIWYQGIKPVFPLKIDGGLLGLSKYEVSAVRVFVLASGNSGSVTILIYT